MEATFAPMGGHLGGPIASAQASDGSSMGEVGRALLPGDVFPDLHHKMSKKIAQLTKVIYHLNTKNEDHQFELEEVRGNHKKEMQDILKDAATKIQSFKDQLASKKGHLNAQAQMEKLRQKHEKEKKEAMVEFRAFKRTVRDREEQTQRECRDRVADLDADIKKEKKAFEASLKRFQERGQAMRAALDSVRSSASGNVATLKEKHKAELEEAIREGNDKFNKMITEQLLARETLKRQMEEQAKDARHQLDQEIGRLRAELAADKEAALLKARRESDEELQATRMGLLEKVERAAREANRLREEGAAFSGMKDQETAGLRKEVERVSDDLSRLKRASQASAEVAKSREASLEEHLTQAVAQRDRLDKELQAALSSAGQAGRAEEGVRGELEALKRCLKNVEQEKEAIKREATLELIAKDHSLATKLGEISSLQQKLQSTISEQGRTKGALEVELDEARNRAAAEGARAEEAISAGKAREVEVARERQAAEAAVSQLRGKLGSLGLRCSKLEEDLVVARELAEKERSKAEEAEAQGRATEEVLRADLEGGSRAWAEKVALKEKEFLDRLGSERSQLQEELEEQQKGEEAKLEAVKLESKRLQDVARKNTEELEARLLEQAMVADTKEHKLKLEVEKLDEDLCAMRGALEASKSDQEQRQGEIDRLTKDLRKAREELQSSRRGWEQELASQRVTREVAARSLEDRFVQEMAEALEQASTKAAESTRLEVERVTTSLQSEHQEELLKAKARLEEAVKEMRSAEARHMREIGAAGRVAKEREEAAEARRQELMDSHAKQMDQESVRHNNAIGALKAQLIEESRAASSRLQSELKSLEGKSAKALEEARRVAEMEKLTAVAKCSRELEGNHQLAMLEVVSRLEGERDAEAKCLARAREELLAKEEETTRVQGELSEARASMSQLLAVTEAETQRMRADIKARQGALVAKHASELSHAEGRYRDKLRETEEGHSQKQEELNARLAKLEAAHTLLAKRYDNRPSREEDVARIRALEADAFSKDALVARTKEEMAYFKRELLNREENYNKKFNANPVVGVMQVVRPKNTGIHGVVGSVPPPPKPKHRPPRINKETRSASLPVGCPESGAETGESNANSSWQNDGRGVGEFSSSSSARGGGGRGGGSSSRSIGSVGSVGSGGSGQSRKVILGAGRKGGAFP